MNAPEKCYENLALHNYSLLLGLVTFNKHLPLLKTALPFWFLVTNRISSKPSAPALPRRQISVVRVSPGRTGDAKRAWNSFKFAGSLPPRRRRMPCAEEFQLNKP